MGENTEFDLGALDFTPAWVRGEAQPVPPPTGGGERRGRLGGDRDRREGGRDRRADAGFGGGNRREGARKFGPREGRGNFDSRRARPFAERPREPLFDVQVLPESRALGTIIRKLQGDYHAYKLKDLAYFFLDNPKAVLLKVLPRKVEGAAAPAAPMSFFQCRVCSFATTSEAELAEHILSSHLNEYFETREVTVEPPKGNFNCVARCSLSGVLLGPPNLHEFGDLVREMVRTRFPNLTEAQYRERLEMVRESDVIEQWRQGATKRTVYVAKGGTGEELSRSQAEGEFRRSMLPSLVDRPKHLMLTAELALTSPIPTLAFVARRALEEERRAPYAMCRALRGAFHNRNLKFFRANDAHGQEFVTAVELKEFDAEHAVSELKAAAEFLKAHPCSLKGEFPGGEEGGKQLEWLVSTGHAVAFTNGVYSAVEKFPKYGPQWRRDRPLGPATAEAPAAVEAPAASADAESAPMAAEASVPAAAPEAAAPVAETPVAAPEADPAPVSEAVATAVEVQAEEGKENEAPAQLA